MLDNSKIRSTELYATLSQATKDVTAIREWLYASKDRIDEHILENLNAFDEKVKEALQNYENLSDEKLNMLKELYKKVVYPFDYVSDEEPTMPNVNETWFKTDEAKIFKFIKNPQITFLQKERPKERKINDIWFKPMDDVNLQVGEFYLCEKVLKNEAWINPSLPENLEPAFNQEEAPQNATLGDIWKKGDEYLVYIKTTSGNSWTSPENPSEYTPTYESEEEPSEAKLGEIWKKGNEYLIYARVTNDTAWILKSDLGLDAFIWFNEEKENINFILSLIGDLKKEDEKEETSKNEIKDLEQNLSNKQEELENIKKQIEEALAKDPPQNVDNLNEKKTQLEQEITKMQEDLNHKQNELEQIQKDKSLVSQKMLSDALKEKVGLKGDETLNGNKTLNGDNIFNGANTFNQALTSPTNPTNDNHLTRKSYVDYGGGIKNLGNQTAPKIDLRQAQHFILTMTARGAIGIANWGGAGKSGTITVNNAQNITAFSAPFKFRVAQSGFSGTETFAYFCIAANNIRLVRT
ncbi:coiled-coil domain-containing protein [Campylobacter coli]|uniref:coiled-coil domain-containing protein n=1 Tax=Campylobacter coli TaxID=195 RepID=UPI0036F3AA93